LFHWRVAAPFPSLPCLDQLLTDHILTTTVQELETKLKSSFALERPVDPQEAVAAIQEIVSQDVTGALPLATASLLQAEAESAGKVGARSQVTAPKSLAAAAATLDELS
jgi:2-oxo-4-hydroxy-4-carboxy--5-ureidoimidazoline (OHCU) decarboxylase